MKTPHAKAAMRGEISDAQRLRKMHTQPPVDARKVETAHLIERVRVAGIGH
jgi:hypothetical protein